MSICVYRILDAIEAECGIWVDIKTMILCDEKIKK